MASVLDLVRHYQHNIEKYPDDEQKILKAIDKLFQLDVKVQHLQETGVGRTVNALRKEPGHVGKAARALVYKWKRMVAAEESDQEGDNENSIQNGHGSEKDSDDGHHPQSSSQMNGEVSGAKRKYHCGEYEEPDRKKTRHSRSSDSDDDKKNRIKSEPQITSEGSDSHSESDVESELSEEDEKPVIVKTEPVDKDTSKHSHNKHIKTESSSSKQSHESEHHSSKQSKFSERHRAESSSKSSHNSNDKSSREKQENSDRKHRDHKSDKERAHKVKDESRQRDKEERARKEETSRKEKEEKLSKEKEQSSRKDKESSHSSSKHSSDKHRSSSSQKESRSDKHKGLEKSKSGHENKSDKHSSSKHEEKHKSSSAKETPDKHKSQDNSGSCREKNNDKPKDSSKDKERSSSHSKSDKKHSSSKSRSESKSKSGDETPGDKGDKKSSNKSSSADKSKSSSSKSKQDKPKKKVSIQETNVDSDDGIGCESGASFAEALGMVVPTKTKKKQSSTPIKDTGSPGGPADDFSPATMLAPTAKLAPLPAIEISALPEISPNYKPRPPPKFQPHFNEEDAMNMTISSKNARTKVFSGTKTFGRIPSLYEMCVYVLQEHIDALEYTGGVPYEILKPVVDKATPQQLFVLEHYNPYLMEDTDHLWQKFCEKHFRSKRRQELESWREMYMRCQEEQEQKLKSLTANIRMTQEAKKAPIKQTKMAYVDSVVKPPRNIARKQAQHGTAHAAAASPAARVAALAAAPNVLRGGARAAPAPCLTASTSAFNKPKKAPLMQKALQFMRGRKR